MPKHFKDDKLELIWRQHLYDFILISFLWTWFLVTEAIKVKQVSQVSGVKIIWLISQVSQ